MKKILSGFLAVMCLAGVALAKDNVNKEYLESANKQIAKIMNSDKGIHAKVAILTEKVGKLATKKELNEKQKVELRELYFNLGKVNYETLNNYFKAAEYFTKAGALRSDGLVEFCKGNALYHTKNYTDALMAYQNAVAKGDLAAKYFPELFWMKGCAEYFLGNYGAAENELQKALSLDGSRWEQAARYIVVCLQKRGAHEEALQWLDRLAKNRKNMDFVWRKAANIYCETGKYEDCARSIAELEAHYPLDEALCLLRAQLGYATGDYKYAQEQLQQEFAKAQRSSTYDYECNIMMAQLALQEGKYDDALAYVDRAVREPMPTYSTKLKGDIYLAMGDKAKALEYYDAFLKISPSASRNAYVAEQVAKLQNELLEASTLPENQ